MQLSDLYYRFVVQPECLKDYKQHEICPDLEYVGLYVSGNLYTEWENKHNHA